MSEAALEHHDSASGGFEQWMMWLLKSIPGHNIIVRYIASSYQNDPIRSILELILFIFAVRTILQNRTFGRGTSQIIKLTDKVRVYSLTPGNRLPCG